MNNQEIELVIEQYRTAFKQNSKDWDAGLRPRPAIPSDQVEIIQDLTLEMLGFEGGTQNFLQGLLPQERAEDISVQELQRVFVESLRNDILQCLDDGQKVFLRDVHFCFLDIGFVNACCVSADANGNPIDGFIVFINEGLYFSLMHLFAAVVFEELQGDLKGYKKDSKEVFKHAIDMYAAPSREKILPDLGQVGDPVASAEIERHISSTATLILQFVALHEFGHAWLGHHEVLKNYHLALVESEALLCVENVWEKNHSLEYAADEFAFSALVARTQTIEANWAHCFLVYLFFRYMAEAEKKAGSSISRLHPKPIDRANAIKHLLMRTFPESSDHAVVLDRADELISKWAN